VEFPEAPKADVPTRLLLKRLYEVISTIVPIGVAVLVTIIITIYHDELANYATYGYLGIFVACVAANSTVLLPAPSSGIVFAFGNVYPPFWVAVAGGLGATTGELVGYFAGWSGRRIVDRSEKAQRVKEWVKRYGELTIFIFAFLPLPLFDLVGGISGALRLNLFRFLIPTILGKILKMMTYAYAGAGLLPLLEPIIHGLMG
jgi:membrane protein YqaA with SNARE-associated domain